VEKLKKNTSSKEKIKQSAFILFQKNGYTKTTTRMIAKAAGVNETTIFNIFGSKANLFHEIYYTLPPSPDQMSLENLTSGRNLRQDLHLLIYEDMKLTIQNFPMYRFSMPLIDVVEEDLHARSVANVEKSARLFVSYFKYLEAIGAIESFDYEAFTSLIISVFLIKSFDLVKKMPDEENPQVSYDEDALQAFTDQYVDWLYQLATTAGKEEN